MATESRELRERVVALLPKDPRHDGEIYGDLRGEERGLMDDLLILAQFRRALDGELAAREREAAALGRSSALEAQDREIEAAIARGLSRLSRDLAAIEKRHAELIASIEPRVSWWEIRPPDRGVPQSGGGGGVSKTGLGRADAAGEDLKASVTACGIPVGYRCVARDPNWAFDDGDPHGR